MNGASPSKLVLGIPTYGMSFTLKQPIVAGHQHPSGQVAISGAGKRGPYTGEKGTLAYYEVRVIYTYNVCHIYTYSLGIYVDYYILIITHFKGRLNHTMDSGQKKSTYFITY